jgi:phosphatidylglycerophosphatase C
MTSGNKLVIFDLDGVLTKKDTFLALLITRARRSPLRAIYAVPALVRWLLSSRDVSRNAQAARQVASQMLHGISRPEYEAMATLLGAALGRDDAWTRPSALNELATSRAEGHRVVIATASERVLAAAYLASAGADYDELVASEIEFPASGRPRFTAHLRGQAKLEGLRERGINPVDARFYTDSFDDAPTATASREVVLVAPSDHDVAAYRSAGIQFLTLQ